jgi:transcriptional regulator with XRE-family HTH domain
MGELGELIDAYKDRFEYEVSSAAIARRLGVTRTSIGKWYTGSMPTPENLRALSTLMNVPYTRLLDAALADAGYLPKKEREGDAVEPATNKQAGASPATEVNGRRVTPRTPGRPARKPRSAPSQAQQREPQV